MNNGHGFGLLAAALTGFSGMNAVGLPQGDEAPKTVSNAVAGAQDRQEQKRALSASDAALAASPATNQLRLNFRGAPLNLVLDYLSDAAGFVINKQTEVSGSIDAWSAVPVSREEAVDLLNAALRKSGCAAIRRGRILTIVRLDTAKTADLDVVVGNDAGGVERSDEVVTQVIPVRHANASQLLNNLQVLLPGDASLSANESANTLILVASKTDIKRMLKIISALDGAIASVSSIKVIPLRYADAKQLATVVQQLFAPQASGQGGGMNRGQRFNFPGGGFGPPGMGGSFGGAPNGSDSSSGGNAAGARVVAVADDTSNSLVVSAPADLMTIVTDMAQKIDQPVADITELRVFHLGNADPTELADQLSQLFPDTSRSGSDQNQGGFRFGGGPFGPPGFAAAAGQNQSGSVPAPRNKDK